MNVNFQDSPAEIKSFKLTKDGYYVGSVLCARTGTQEYLRSDLGLTGDGTITVYRPEEAVFNKDSMATFAGRPVTMLHPRVPVDSSNWKDLSIGHVGEEVARDGQSVRVSIAVMDEASVKAIQAGTREVSMGYTTPVVMQDGVAPDGTPYQAVQTGPININHLAIVPKARGGDTLRIPDAMTRVATPLNTKDQKPMHRIIIDGISIEVGDQAREAIVKLQGQLADSAKLVATKDADLATKDAELAKKDADILAKDNAIADAKKAIPTGNVLDALVAERASLVDAANMVAPQLKLDGMSNVDIKKAVVRASLGDQVVDGKISGKSEAYVDSFYDANFDIIAETKDSAIQLARNLSGNRSSMMSDAKAEEDAYQGTLKRFERKKA